MGDNAANTWQMQEAEARFSALVENALENGPQVVTRRGVETVVVVPYTRWTSLEQTPMEGHSKEPPQYDDIKEWLLTPDARTETLIPEQRPILLARPAQFD